MHRTTYFVTKSQLTTHVFPTHKRKYGYPSKKEPKIVQRPKPRRQAELIALIGKNGCENPRCCVLWLAYSYLFGEITINGEDILEKTPKERAQLISIVLTNQRSVAAFNVKELISIGRDPYTGWLGSLSADDEKIIAESIEMTNLQGFENRNIHELSDGERQRVFIARALAQNTPIILLDEPTSHLDLPNRISILLLLQKLARETGKTIFISTHELETAMQVADKIWLMENERCKNRNP